jgi:hypothetical protein
MPSGNRGGFAGKLVLWGRECQIDIEVWSKCAQNVVEALWSDSTLSAFGSG